jgi:hypothetical protein
MLVRSDRAQGQVRTVTDVVPAKMADAFGKAVVILKLMIQLTYTDSKSWTFHQR